MSPVTIKKQLALDADSQPAESTISYCRQRTTSTQSSSSLDSQGHGGSRKSSVLLMIKSQGHEKFNKAVKCVRNGNTVQWWDRSGELFHNLLCWFIDIHLSYAHQRNEVSVACKTISIQTIIPLNLCWLWPLNFDIFQIKAGSCSWGGRVPEPKLSSGTRKI